MHGNTFTADSGHKTRRFDDVLDEYLDGSDDPSNYDAASNDL